VDELEKALKAALQREPAPERLFGEVLRKAGLRSAPVSAWWRLPVLRRSLAGAVAVACIAGGVSEHFLEQRRQERMRGEQARQQVLLALRITGAKLRVVRKQVAKTTDDGGGH
jgi:hypothetical protein